VAPVVAAHGRPLDHIVRSGLEARFGADLTRVRIHDDAGARTSAASLGSLAYTVGDHIVLGDVGHLPAVARAQVLAHELAHTVQHSGGGRDAAPDQLTLGGRSDKAESEASAAALRVTAGGRAGTVSRGADVLTVRRFERSEQ